MPFDSVLVSLSTKLKKSTLIRLEALQLAPVTADLQRPRGAVAAAAGGAGAMANSLGNRGARGRGGVARGCSLEPPSIFDVLAVGAS